MVTIAILVLIVAIAAVILILAGLLTIPVLFAFLDVCAAILLFEAIKSLFKAMFPKKK